MPVANPEIAKSDFLREFNFSTGFGALLSELFGELPQPAWLELHFTALGLDHLRIQHLFEIHVKTNPGLSGEKLQMAPQWSQLAKRFSVVSMRLPEINQVMGFGVNLSDLRESSDAARVILYATKKILFDFRHKLFEADPRIGFTLDPENPRLVSSPFFDPLTKFPRTYDEFFTRPLEDMMQGIETPSWLRVPCPICGQAFEDYDHLRPQWAGANLLWVHPACWSLS